MTRAVDTQARLMHLAGRQAESVCVGVCVGGSHQRARARAHRTCQARVLLRYEASGATRPRARLRACVRTRAPCLATSLPAC
ncbi:hypothetical protein EON67_04235 [archaeon]|nr:MAG: hypothetical protein EON67_04235 [archaeon]